MFVVAQAVKPDEVDHKACALDRVHRDRVVEKGAPLKQRFELEGEGSNLADGLLGGREIALLDPRDA